MLRNTYSIWFPRRLVGFFCRWLRDSLTDSLEIISGLLKSFSTRCKIYGFFCFQTFFFKKVALVFREDYFEAFNWLLRDSYFVAVVVVVFVLFRRILLGFLTLSNCFGILWMDYSRIDGYWSFHSEQRFVMDSWRLSSNSGTLPNPCE